MDFKFFFNSIININRDPVKAWETIDSENRHVRLVRNSLFLPLIILVSVSASAGSLIFINSEMLPVYSIFAGIKCLCLFYITIFATAFILTRITYLLDLGKDFNFSFRIIVYSVTPFLLCQIISRLFESLLFVNIIGLYGLYIFWTGIEKKFPLPKKKKMLLLFAATIAFIVLFIVSNLLLTMLTDKIYFAFFD
jgi:hypothetical protein